MTSNSSSAPRSTEYVIDDNGRYWLPPFASRMEGWARYNWFRKLMQVEGHSASSSEWKGLINKYQVHVATEHR